MLRTCLKCSRSNDSEEDITLFGLPSKADYPEWHDKFLENLDIDQSSMDLQRDDLRICERHFNPEDLEWNDCTITLRMNALPINDTLEDNELTYVRPELIYLNSNGEVIDENSEEFQEVISREPYVEFHSREDQELDEQLDVNTEYVMEDSIQDDSNETSDGPRIINVGTSGEDGSPVEPMMPFYLSDMPVYTILNENNEVKETIILQIDNPQDPFHVKPKRRSHDDVEIVELHNRLCRPIQLQSLLDAYRCDICFYSYGCFNCLKSHSETMHVTNSQIALYKCKFSHNISKQLCCPVCERLFSSRSETMDHYILHSVECDICGTGFDRQSSLSDHLQTIHNRGDYDTVFECELCKLVMSHSTNLSKHYMSYHHLIICHVCKQRFPTYSELQDHVKVHLTKLFILPYACNLCNEAFANISEVSLHLREGHKKTSINHNSGEKTLYAFTN